MDQGSFNMRYWGSRSQDWKADSLQRILPHVQKMAMTEDRLWFLLKDGSVKDYLSNRTPGLKNVANDAMDVFTGGKRVFVRGKDGQLQELTAGMELGEESSNMFIPFPIPSKQTVVQVACGKSHLLILTKFCEMYTKGDNSCGQLGCGKESTNKTRLKTLGCFKGVPISQIAAGACSSFCITISGRVYAWGQNKFGQLGLGNIKLRNETTPKLLKFSTKNAVAFISAGEHHTALLTKKGELFMCGKNSHGQIGSLDVSKNFSTPWRVEELKDSIVTQVACGQTHSIVYVPGCGQVFGYGSNADGQLGFPRSKKFISQPAMLDGPWCDDNKMKVEVFAEGNCTLIVYIKSSGEVLETDYREIPLHRQIAKIGKDLCDNMAGLKEDPDNDNHEQDLEELRLLFGSQSCINASFCSADKRPMTKEFLGIDCKELIKVQCSKDDAGITDEIIKSIRKLILQDLPNTNSTDIETLKVYIILPILIKAMFKDSSRNALFLPLLKIALDYHGKDFEWLLQLVDREYFASFLSLCKDILTALEKSVAGGIDDRLRYPAEALKILHQVNEKRGLLQYQEFYIRNVCEEVLSMHYNSWKVLKPRGWNICEYPFLLDAKAKTTLLQIHSKTRLRMKSISHIVLEIDREDLVQSATKLEEIKDIQRPLRIKFLGEEGYDDGALKKEYFMLIFRELLDKENNYGLFVEDETSKLLWFPAHHDDDKETLKLYTFIGKLCGMALYNGVIVNLNLPLVLYKEIAGEKPTFEDFIELNPYFGRSLEQILDFTEEDGLTVEETFCCYFTTTDGIPLKDGGEDIAVTADNRQEFVDLNLEYFFHKSVQSKLNAFKTGFFQAFAQDMLSLFRPRELMEMVTGINDFDWETLKDSTKYESLSSVFAFHRVHEDFHKDHYIIKWFWEALLSMDKHEKNKFLIFLTGSNKIPITGLDMKIKKVCEPDDYLPVAEVCYNTLHLNVYSSKEVLRERLLHAIECTTFGRV